MYPPVVRRNRKVRQNVAALAGLIATPATAPFVMPANTPCIARTTTNRTGVVAAVSLEGYDSKVIETQDLQVNENSTRFYVEKDTNVTLEAGFQLLADIGLGRYVVIAEA